ncbi:MAG: type I-C CRISPR-associated protein Cas5c [Halanaerobiales bacterium]
MFDDFKYPPVQVKVWGDFACFTRPDMKVERMSYRVMTPSAARGILSSIFWKPEFHWIIQKIKILNPIRHISVRRNEVKQKISPRSVKTWMKNKKHDRYFADQDRTQRNTLALRDVSYIIEANIQLKKHAENIHPAKYRDQFRRRVNKGKCYKRPYLGNREFSAYFAPVDGSEKAIDVSDQLGRMLFDLQYDNGEDRNKPIFFNAELMNGVMDIPVEKYDEVWGNEK